MPHRIYLSSYRKNLSSAITWRGILDIINSTYLIRKTKYTIFVFTNTLKKQTMKTTGKLFTLLFVLAGLTSCYSSIPLEKKPSENNTTYTVSYLFEHEGIKVYRFFDMGNYVYFTTRGDVTSIKNDSTGERTITIYKDSIRNK